MALIREPTHRHNGAGILLRNRLLHSSERDGEHRGDDPDGRRDKEGEPEASPRANTRRDAQVHLLLTGHGVRVHIHIRVFGALLRGPQPLQVRPLHNEHHRRGGHSALLHRPHHRQERRAVGRFRHVACLPCLSRLQVLATLAGLANSRLYAQELR